MYELITTLPALKSLADWLLKLASARGGERRFRFETLVKPLHASLQEAHLDYAGAMKELRRALPAGGPGIGWRVDGAAHELDDAQALAAIGEAKRRFDRARLAREPMREWLRLHAREILLSAPGEEERRYLHAILLYFIEEGRPAADERGLGIEPILRKGGPAMLRTPSSRLAAEIAKTDDPEAIGDAVGAALDALEARAAVALRAYVALAKAAA